MIVGANRLTSRATPGSATGPPTPSAQMRAFVNAFERLGYNVAGLLTEAGLVRADLDDPDALIPCATVGEFMGRACRSRPTLNLGIRLAGETPNGAFPLLDYLAGTCEDVRQAFAQVARYLHLAAAPVSMQLAEEDDPVTVRYLPHSPGDVFSVEYTVALHLRRLREETDGQASALYVSFTHCPDDPADVERRLACPLHLNASWAGFALSRDHWRHPLRRRDAVLHAMLERHAGDVAARRPALEGIALDVHQVIISHLTRGRVTLDGVARQLAVSPRTLQRRLARSGWSFDGLAERLGRDVAEKHLSQSVLSIAEVAYLLGYSEPAAFHRAFKRWTGVTPSAFRANASRAKKAPGT